MDLTENLDLPFIMPSQAQKHVTHNEALRMLDALVQCAVVSADLSEPPADPAAGERHIVAGGATGAWAGRDGRIAAWQDGAWAFLTPQSGWRCHVADRNALWVHDGAAWAPLPAPAEQDDLAHVGINAAADATNRLAVSAPASLFTHEGSDHRLKINKASQTDTASLLLQDNWQGRAEIGLAGNDDLAVKVSADGAAWHEAMTVDRATGRVVFPSGGVREMLFAARTYHVDPAGSDAADGLSPETAFATLQKAVDAALALDANGREVTIQLADGTYTAGASMSRPMFDGGTLKLAGNAASPSSVLISAGTGTALMADAAGAKLRVEGVKFAGQVGVWARYGAVVLMRGENAFGACTARHVGADNAGYVEIIGATTIEGGAQQHLYATANGNILMAGSTVTLTGTPVFSSAFAYSQMTGIVSAYSNSYSGAASGVRYRVSMNGVIFVSGAGETVFPGNAAGTALSGGQYG